MMNAEGEHYFDMPCHVRYVPLSQVSYGQPGVSSVSSSHPWRLDSSPGPLLPWPLLSLIWMMNIRN